MSPIRSSLVLLLALSALACNFKGNKKEPTAEQASAQLAAAEKAVEGRPAEEENAAPTEKDAPGENAENAKAGKSVVPSEALQSTGVTLNQLTESTGKEQHKVEVYAVFTEAFDKKPSLRALDEKGEELGRSDEQAPLKQAADSSSYLTFTFDLRMPIEKVKTYELHESLDGSGKSTDSKAKAKNNPDGYRGTRRSAPSGLVAKDPRF